MMCRPALVSSSSAHGGDAMRERRALLILATTDVSRDARVARQVSQLKGDYDVTVAATGPPEDTDVEFIQLEMHRLSGWNPIRNRSIKAYRTTLLCLGWFETYYWKQRWVREAVDSLVSRSHDCILANDMDMLPLALRVSGAAPVVFDAHEFYPGQYDDASWQHRLHAKYANSLCRHYIGQASATITVSPGIAEEYYRRFNVAPAVVENCPAFSDLEPQDNELNTGRVRLIHHGACRLSRGLGRLIKMMEHLDDRFELNFMLTGDRTRREYQELLRLAANSRNVHFHDPVSVDDIAQTLNQFDIGVYLLDPISLNHRLALPNKFFDFIQGRLAIGIGPSPEMARLVDEHQLGVVSKDFSPRSLAERLNMLSTSDILRFKQNSHKAARFLCAESVGKRMLSTLEAVTDGLLKE